MKYTSKKTLRHAAVLVYQRIALIASGILYALIIPRLMGPQTYGQFTLLLSLCMLFTMTSSLGFMQIVTRYGAELSTNNDEENLRRLFGNLLTFRIFGGLIGSAIYFALLSSWLTEIDTRAVFFMSCSLAMLPAGDVCFLFFLGMHRAADWGLGYVLRRLLLVPALALGYLAGGLVGACMATAITELCVLIVGLWWARPYSIPRWRGLDAHFMAPYLKFGFTFYVGGMILAAVRHSGESIIRITTHDYMDVGFFGLALSLYLAASGALTQVSIAFIPFLTSLRVKGDEQAVTRWVETLLRWMTLGALTVVLAALFLGRDLIGLVMGSSFLPVTNMFIILSMTLVALVLGNTAHGLAMVYERPRVSIQVALVRVVLFWLIAFPMASWKGGLGVSIAYFCAASFYAVLYNYRMSSSSRTPLRRWATCIVLFLPIIPLVHLKGSWQMNASLFGGSLAVYTVILIWLRIITLREIGSIWRVFRTLPVKEVV